MSVPSVPIELQAVPESQEQQYVHEVYNEIATHFSQTRYKPWPIVEKFLLGQKDYSIGIDVGCGNGKYLGVNKQLMIVGSDRSDGLVACARENSKNAYSLCVADGLHLPHENNRFDFAISIAVIHHFASEERRIDAIRHILSKLRSGGRALIYCWALEQEKSRRGYKEGDDQDILVPWVLQKRTEKNMSKKKKKSRAQSTSGSSQDSLHCKQTESNTISETAAGDTGTSTAAETKYRYYHLYREGELLNNAISAGGLVVEHGYEKDNWWVIVEKQC